MRTPGTTGVVLATLSAEPLSSHDAAVLAIHGDLDIAAAARVRTAIGDLMGQGVRHLEVDLDGCDFIDSTGIGALLWGARRMQAAGGDLVAVHVHGAAARTLEVSGVVGLLEIR